MITSACLLALVLGESASAQLVPTVIQVPASVQNPPIPVPSALKLNCMSGPDVLTESATCSVLEWAGYSYWVLTYVDNRSSMKIIAYDASKEVVAQWEKAGARYPWKITTDNDAQTVTFHGQANGRIMMTWSDLSIYTPFYRSYDGKNHDHFYTTSKHEGNQAQKFGWVQEGICCRILGTPSPRTVPLLRFFNPTGVDHFYTTEPAKENLEGYVFENIAGYVYPAQLVGTIPLFRLYLQLDVPQPDSSIKMDQDHFYTIDVNEKNEAIEKHKYVDEGIAGYVLPSQ